MNIAEQHEQQAQKSLVLAVKILKEGLGKDTEPSAAVLAHRAISENMKDVSQSVLEDAATILATAWLCIKEHLDEENVEPFLTEGTPLVKIITASSFSALDECEVELYEDFRLNLRIINDYVDYSGKQRPSISDLVTGVLDSHTGYGGRKAKLSADEVKELSRFRDSFFREYQRIDAFIRDANDDAATVK